MMDSLKAFLLQRPEWVVRHAVLPAVAVFLIYLVSVRVDATMAAMQIDQTKQSMVLEDIKTSMKSFVYLQRQTCLNTALLVRDLGQRTGAVLGCGQ